MSRAKHRSSEPDHAVHVRSINTPGGRGSRRLLGAMWEVIDRFAYRAKVDRWKAAIMLQNGRTKP